MAFLSHRIDGVRAEVATRAGFVVTALHEVEKRLTPAPPAPRAAFPFRDPDDGPQVTLKTFLSKMYAPYRR